MLHELLLRLLSVDVVEGVDFGGTLLGLMQEEFGFVGQDFVAWS